MAVVSSPERWACDYCHSWCVKVQGGIARDDHRGTTQFAVHGRPHMVKGNSEPVVQAGPPGDTHYNFEF
jgi:hypothetical protein